MNLKINRTKTFTVFTKTFTVTYKITNFINVCMQRIGE